ncbi:MAG: hypothetical protein HY226_04280, partial [Candidatus Vogelbacteria bacterium]|nr:hypothetical protein [Candidatus Vogelbacteria bacterium]
GEFNTVGIQKLKLPKTLDQNSLYLDGTWEFSREFATNKTPDAKISIKYSAKEVYLVAGSDATNTITVLQDGKKANVNIANTDIYKLTINAVAGEHTLQITITNPGLNAYVLRFR